LSTRPQPFWLFEAAQERGGSFALERTEAQKCLCALQEASPVFEPIEPPVDALGDAGQIIGIGERVEVALGPEPACHIDAQIGIGCEQLGSGEEFSLPGDGASVFAVIGAPGQLDEPAPLEAAAIARLRIAQVTAAFVSLSAGDFGTEAQLAL
jgi:hypothetical protein